MRIIIDGFQIIIDIANEPELFSRFMANVLIAMGAAADCTTPGLPTAGECLSLFGILFHFNP